MGLPELVQETNNIFVCPNLKFKYGPTWASAQVILSFCLNNITMNSNMGLPGLVQLTYNNILFDMTLNSIMGQPGLDQVTNNNILFGLTLNSKWCLYYPKNDQ